MRTKILISLFSLVFFGLVFLYYFLDASYSMSIKAKYFYYQNSYEKALFLAQKAYEKNNYNMMAFTIITQSKESIKWQKFVDEASAYLGHLKDLSQKQPITKADEKEMKITAEVVFDSYSKLQQKSPFIDKDLRKKADYLVSQFKIIYERVK